MARASSSSWLPVACDPMAFEVKPKHFAIAGAIWFAFIAGLSHATPETKIVKVPEVHTHVVTQEVPTDLPVDCRTAISDLNKLLAANGLLTKGAGDAQNALSDVIRDTATRDVPSLNDSMEALTKAKDSIDTAAITQAQIAGQISTIVSQCNEQVAKR